MIATVHLRYTPSHTRGIFHKLTTPHSLEHVLIKVPLSATVMKVIKSIFSEFKVGSHIFKSGLELITQIRMTFCTPSLLFLLRAETKAVHQHSHPPFSFQCIHIILLFIYAWSALSFFCLTNGVCVIYLLLGFFFSIYWLIYFKIKFHSAAQACLELVVFFRSQPPECWDLRVYTTIRRSHNPRFFSKQNILLLQKVAQLWLTEQASTSSRVQLGLLFVTQGFCALFSVVRAQPQIFIWVASWKLCSWQA